jgi:diguanylate cyclase (GGDEF)-like protein
LGQPDKALGLLNQAFESIKTRGANRFRYQYHELLARIHENRGDYPLAIEHFKNFHEIKSQVYSEETRRRLDNLVVSQQAETARIDAEIYRLKNLSLRQEVVAHRQAAAEMEILATTDSLTGLLNRRHFFTLGGYAFESARKQKQPMAVLMFDIDDFKKVNDRYGHLTGDQVLIEVSSVIHACLRKADLLCRYGGEEFVAVLPETTELAAQRAAERILKKVSRPITRKGVPGVCITLSIGIALAKTGDGDLEAALNRADQALYAAKHNGKNQAVTA